MKELNLNHGWHMRQVGMEREFACEIPCSVYSVLTRNNEIPDPYYGENQYEAFALSRYDYDFFTEFDAGELLSEEKVYLVFNGIDTIADIYLNGSHILYSDNMHRRWEIEVKSILKETDNKLTVRIKSPLEYIAKKDSEYSLWGVSSTTKGYPHIRKAHCMFGWDWGLSLPDMGIWRDVILKGVSHGRILDTYARQRHSDGRVCVDISVNAEPFGDKPLSSEITLTSPQGESITQRAPIHSGVNAVTLTVENPQLWWVRGLGSQPLYDIDVKLYSGDDTADEAGFRIGLRTLSVSREKDKFGEEFCFICNGVKLFSMGANYIPDDQIISRCDRKRVLNTLEQCLAANYNTIRVWGGGYYPDDFFYDFCDEHGIIVWQDFMYACSVYRMTDAFSENARLEAVDNIKRLRNHASLGLFCGNNEIESAVLYWGIPQDESTKPDYLKLFEDILPKAVAEYSPDTFYWPSSPSSGGDFCEPSSEEKGDMHYWDVWHNFKPIEDFKRHFYRFCSEYGFESLPSIKTIRSFCEEVDMNISSPVMEAHQKCELGNEKLMFYIPQLVRMPDSFERLIYATQLLQAEAIRSDVEFMRRNRGRCMGSLYWQVNDSNPVISWSSIDYFGRWKALHYYAKRFYTPILLSVEVSDDFSAVFNISNETMSDFDGKIIWRLRDKLSKTVAEGEIAAKAKSLSASDFEPIDISGYIASNAEKRGIYLEYRLISGDAELYSGTNLFVKPKHFTFADPQLTAEVFESDDRYTISISAKAYAKGVYIELPGIDCVFSDNWFDINAGESVLVTVEKSSLSDMLSLNEFEAQVKIMSCYDL